MPDFPLSRLWHRAAPYLVLLAEVLLFFRRVLFSRGFIIPYDLPGYHLPLAYYAARSLGAGELPLWDPFTYCGLPFYANLQAQVFYPPAWIFFGLANLLGLDALQRLLTWQVALHVFAGGVGAYLLLRRLRLDWAAALFGGTVFQLGGYFTSQTQHLGAICGAAWLPFAWLCVLELCERPGWRWTAALAVILALSILAGFPAVTIAVVASTWLQALALAVRRPVPVKGLALAAAATLWSALLAAIQLLPTRELISLSVARMRGQWTDDAGGVPWQGLVSLLLPNHFHVFDREQFTLPWNETFLYLYGGLATLLLAAAALARRDRPAAVFTVMTLGSGFLMMGGTTPPGHAILAALPTAVKSPLYPEFFSAAFVLGIACLAALGVARWMPRLGPALVLLTILDLYWVGSNRHWNTQPADRVAPVRENSFEGSPVTIAGVRRLIHQTTPPARIDVWQGSAGWMPAAPIEQVPTANGNDPLVIHRLLEVRRLFAPGPFWERYHEVTRPESPILDLLNVRYILTYAPDAKPRMSSPGLRLAAVLPGHQVYENLSVLPRFFLVGRTRPAASLQEALAILGSPGFDPSREAVVEGAAAFTGGEGVVRVRHYSARSVELETESATPSFLVTSETWYPGWRATIDGQQQPLVMTNGAFRGLALPAGRHKVEMHFTPSILWWGASSTLLACLAAVPPLTWRALRRVAASRIPTCETGW